MSQRPQKLWHWMPLNIRFIFAATLISASGILALDAFYWYYHIPFLAEAFLALFCTHFIILYIILKYQSYRLPSWLLLAQIACCIGVAVAVVGGTAGPLLYWLTILPLAGGIILQRDGILGGSAFGALVLILVALGECFTDLSARQISLGGGFDMAAFSVYVLLINITALEYVRTGRAVHRQEARKLRSLLDIVTHDLASPLTLVLFGAKKMTLDEEVDQGRRTAALKLYQAATMMKTLIDKVRKIKTLQDGKMLAREDDSSTSLDLCFADIALLYEDRLTAKMQTLELQIDPLLNSLPLAVDPVLLLHDVLGNLISNAIKFSPRGASIEVFARRKRMMMEISVRDRGFGIAADILPFIFDDSVVTHRKGTDGERGTGFGLPLVQYIVMSWSGRVEVSTTGEDGPERGTTISFTLPIAPETEEEGERRSFPGKSA